MSTPARYPLSRLVLGLALAAALLATLPAAAAVLVPDGPLVEVGSIGPGYTPAQLAPLAAQTPRLVMDGAGGFTIFWWQADKSLAEPRLMTRRFDASGEPMWIPQEFWDPVDGVGGVRGLDDAAMNADGDFAVAWMEDGAAYLRTFDPCRFPYGPIVALGHGQAAPGHQALGIESVAVGIAADDSVVVAWVQAVQAPAADGGAVYDEVVVERLDREGAPLAAATRLAAHGDIVGLDVEMAADGSYGVAVESLTADPAASRVELALFDPAGAPMAVPPMAGDHASMESPRLAADAAGSFLLAYADSGGSGPDGLDGSCSGIFAHAHAGDGTPIGGEARVNDVAAGCQRRPAAAGMGGGWAVAWAGADADESFAADGADYGVWVQPVAADGSAQGGAVRVLPGWASGFDLAAGGERAAVAAVLSRGPKEPARVVVQRLGPPEPAGCGGPLCLQEARFRVDADWRDPYNETVGLGSGFDVPSVADSGAFWFFTQDNLELLVKVLDGRGVNGHWWVFSGALTTVEYWLTVTDLATGGQRVYHNKPFVQASIADTAAFGAAAAEGGARAAAPAVLAGGPVAGGVLAVPAAELGGSARRTAPLTPVACGGSDTRLCLKHESFAVGVEWTNPRTGVRGEGRVVPMTADTGGFWFFNPNNVELMVKVLDGRPVNGHWWVFYAGLSDVEYRLTVTPPSGSPVTYVNPAFEVTSGADTAAIAE